MAVERTFEPQPKAVHEARELALDEVKGWSGPVRETVALLVSELATNAIVHGGTRFIVRVLGSDRGVRVEVTDRGGGHPCVLDRVPDRPAGRGLWLVNAMSTRWGMQYEAGATTVWFESDGGF